MAEFQTVGALVLLVITIALVVSTIVPQIHKAEDATFDSISWLGAGSREERCNEQGFVGWTREQFLDEFQKDINTEQLISTHKAYMNCFGEGEASWLYQEGEQSPTQILFDKAVFEILEPYRKNEKFAYLTADEAEGYLEKAKPFVGALTVEDMERLGYPVLKLQADMLKQCKDRRAEVEELLSKEDVRLHSLAQLKAYKAHQHMNEERKAYGIASLKVAQNPRYQQAHDQGKVNIFAEEMKVNCFDQEEYRSYSAKSKEKMTNKGLESEYYGALCAQSQGGEFADIATAFVTIWPEAKQYCTNA